MITWLGALESGGDCGEVLAGGYIYRKQGGLSDLFSCEFLAVSKFLYTILRTKWNLALLTNRSPCRSWSHVNNGISKPEKVQLISTMALSLWACGALLLIPGSINFAWLTFSDSTPAIIEITLLNKLESFQLHRGLECWWHTWWLHAD